MRALNKEGTGRKYLLCFVVYICYFEDEDAYYIESERNDIHVLFQEPEESANE